MKGAWQGIWKDGRSCCVDHLLVPCAERAARPAVTDSILAGIGLQAALWHCLQPLACRPGWMQFAAQRTHCAAFSQPGFERGLRHRTADQVALGMVAATGA